uniref:SLPTX13 n=1 Tax=Scolopendra viridis TaxID=118503 RepID=A0A4D5RAQ5_SCOVI
MKWIAVLMIIASCLLIQATKPEWNYLSSQLYKREVQACIEKGQSCDVSYDTCCPMLLCKGCSGPKRDENCQCS